MPCVWCCRGTTAKYESPKDVLLSMVGMAAAAATAGAIEASAADKVPRLYMSWYSNYTHSGPSSCLDIEMLQTWHIDRTDEDDCNGYFE